MNGSDSIKLKSSEWYDDKNDILELKEVGERGLSTVKWYRINNAEQRLLGHA
jgi:hypothetical protein